MNLVVTNEGDLRKLGDKQFLIDDYSGKYIYLSEFPDYFGLGLNSFLIGIRDVCFQPHTVLHVFYLDSKYQSHPVVVTEYKQRQFIRCYVEVDDTFPIGFGSFILIGTLKSTAEGQSVPEQYQLIENIKRQVKIYTNPNEKTPSVLRFKTKPKVSIELNQKQLFTTQVQTLTENFPLSSISLIPRNFHYTISATNETKSQLDRNMFLFEIDTQHFANSVFYEKFLNYAVTASTIEEVCVDYTQIFSGSDTSNTLHLGKYKGQLTNIFQDLTTSFCNLSLTNGLAIIDSTNPLVVDKLYGTNISSFTATPQSIFGITPPKEILYLLYGQGESTNSIINANLSNIYSRINPITFVSRIEYAEALSMQTAYFHGEILTPNSQIFSDQFTVETSSPAPTYYVGSYYKNPLIKDPSKYVHKTLIAGETYSSYVFTSSNNYTLSATDNTIFQRANIQNAYFLNDDYDIPITFNIIQGEIFSKHLTTTFQDVGVGSVSHLTGSLIGEGSFLTYESGSNVTVDGITTYYDVDEEITLTEFAQFSGSAYNVLVNIHYFSGSIHTGSLVHKSDLYHNATYSGMHYKKYRMESPLFQVQLQNLNTLQVFVPSAIPNKSKLEIQVDRIDEGNLLLIITGSSYFSSSNEAGIVLEGNFGIAETQSYGVDFTFEGYYQNAQLEGNEIQKYTLIQSYLTTQYQDIFNTAEVLFLNDVYSKFYVPIAVDANIDELDWFFKNLYNTQSETYSVDITFTFQNQTQPSKAFGDSETLPVNIVIEEAQIYSGTYDSFQVYYSDTPPYTNYQLLSVANVDSTEFPLTKSLDLPVLAFAGETTHFQIKHRNIRGQYCPSQFFNLIYGLEFSTEQVLQMQKTYNITYLGTGQISGVTSVNGMVGDVELTSEDIPFNASTVHNALEYLYNNIESGSGFGVGGQDVVTFYPQVEFEIGTTESTYTFSWALSPLVEPDSYKYTISYAPYPDEQNFTQSNTGSLDWWINELVIDALSSSAKIQLQVMYNQNQSQSYISYIWFRNSLYCGYTNSNTDVNLLGQGITYSLDDQYGSIYKVICPIDNYIWFACPERMITDVEPEFVVNSVGGGMVDTFIKEHINASGYKETYSHYCSNNHTLGDTILQIRNPLYPE